MEFEHKSIMVNECMELISPQKGGVFVDGTMGGGGHSAHICHLMGKNGLLIGIDRDKDAIAAASNYLSSQGANFKAVRSNYADIKEVLFSLNIQGINGALLDLGVSSYQIDNPQRGFSYMQNSRLDMRMDDRDCISAYEVVNTYDVKRLAKIMKDYSEEKWAVRIASFIEEKRREKPIETTFELIDVIKAAIPAAQRREGGHPAKRVFQALRIEVNGELEKLEVALEDFFDSLHPGGVLAVITFHSLEDRIVKNTFAKLCTGCTCPRSFPICVCGKTPRGKLTNRKPIIPTAQELEENSRAKSAKLRGITRL